MPKESFIFHTSFFDKMKESLLSALPVAFLLHFLSTEKGKTSSPSVYLTKLNA